VVLQILVIGNSNVFAVQSGTMISLLVRLHAVCVFVILPHSLCMIITIVIIELC